MYVGCFVLFLGFGSRETKYSDEHSWNGSAPLRQRQEYSTTWALSAFSPDCCVCPMIKGWQADSVLGPRELPREGQSGPFGCVLAERANAAALARE